jgi:cyclophilin family peptidyl-prolyl cis-trans isomerase
MTWAPLRFGAAFLTCVLLGRGAWVVAADEPLRVKVPVGIPPGLDGYAIPAEWADAHLVKLAGDAAELRLKQHRGVLLLALSMERAWVRGTHLWISVCADLPEMHAHAPGALILDYEPLDHTRPHTLVQRHGEHGPEPVTGAVVVRSTLGGRHSDVELALDLEAAGVKGPKPQGLRIAVSLVRGLENVHPSWPAGLDLASSAGAAPADLLSSARWARLAGWVDVDGPGAWPASDWAAWVAADQELTEKGARAHAKALEIAEESGRKLEKHDGEVERELFETLDWIAAREPLHPYDLMVRAQALRHLNRHDEALAALDGLALVREGDYTATRLYERALTLEGRERYLEAAETWRTLAARTKDLNRHRYEGAVTLAQKKAERAAKEKAARDDDARDATLPRVLLVTSRGTALVVLHARDVPVAVEHFLELVRSPGRDGGAFYDGTLFHRVLGEYLAQGGDPRTRGGNCDAELSGPASVTIPVEQNPRHGFWRGAVGFARGALKENASQFFVLTAPRQELDEGAYTCFGHVVAGMEVIDRLERCDVLERIEILPPAAPTEPR